MSTVSVAARLSATLDYFAVPLRARAVRTPLSGQGTATAHRGLSQGLVDRQGLGGA